MEDSIHLQYVGRHQAKKVRNVVVGEDYFVWNGGYVSQPIRILNETPKTITFQTRTENGDLFERKMFKDRLVAFMTYDQYKRSRDRVDMLNERYKVH